MATAPSFNSIYERTPTPIASFSHQPGIGTAPNITPGAGCDAIVRANNAMKFGIRYCNTCRYVDPANAAELVQAAEATGFEIRGTVKRTVIPRGYQSAYP